MYTTKTQDQEQAYDQAYETYQEQHLKHEKVIVPEECLTNTTTHQQSTMATMDAEIHDLDLSMELEEYVAEEIEFTNKIFVYGTLRPDCTAYREQNCKLRYKTTFHVGYLPNCIMWIDLYPVVEFGHPGASVKGMIIECTDERLEKMLQYTDVIEGFPKYYDRKIETVNTKDGVQHKCWVYYRKSFRKTKQVFSGDYLNLY